MEEEDANGILITYGSLAPGRPNHYVVKHLTGEWFEGFVYGYLENRGWGAGLGCPGMVINEKCPKRKISVAILKSKDLQGFWHQLDGFEGDNYQRILIEYETDEGLKGMGNIYVLE